MNQHVIMEVIVKHCPPVPVIAALAVALALTGCSTGSSTAATGASPASSSPDGATSSAAKSSDSASPSAVVKAVAGGGATDFCGAYREWKDAVQLDTPQQQGAGFRAAATDIRTLAPAEIKQAAALYADVMDEVGQKLEAGGGNPETLGSGQSEERRQALADSVSWIQKNCK